MADLPGAELRVLVVDDEIDAATTLSYLLQILGCRTAVAFGADSGLRILQLFKPSVVFVDLAMVGTDGFGMIERAKVLHPGHVLYVCLTGKMPEEADRALAAGFDRFVVKPMEPDVLTEILAEGRARASSAGLQVSATLSA